MPAVGTRVYFLNNTAEGRIGIVDVVIDLHRVMIHLSAALRANQFIHVRVFPSVSENIRASSRAMPRLRSHVAVDRRFPYRCHTVA